MDHGRSASGLASVGGCHPVFTDIEGSTKLLHEIGDAYGSVLDDHHRLLRDVWTAHDD